MKIIIGFIVCIALFCCSDGKLSEDTNLDLSNWISAVNDTVRVCKMSIPGTHDALTACGFTDEKSIDDYTTQVATFDEQLKGGLRYFDVRLVLEGSSDATILRASHRTATINFTFTDVLDEVKRFLTDNPSEFVIIKIQYDGGEMADSTKRQWTKSVKSVLNDSKYKSFFAEFRPDLRVKDMRGKILLISRTGYGDTVCGALTNWTDEGRDECLQFDSLAERNLILAPTPSASQVFQGGEHPLSARLFVQDYYNTIGNRIAEKQRAVEAMYLSAVKVHPGDNTWIINHVSGFSSPRMNAIGYAENASKANSKLLSLLNADTTSNTGIGIIVMDYACIDSLNQSIGTLGVVRRAVLSKSLTRTIILKNIQ